LKSFVVRWLALQEHIHIRCHAVGQADNHVSSAFWLSDFFAMRFITSAPETCNKSLW
jgi:hypothetical protein